MLLQCKPLPACEQTGQGEGRRSFDYAERTQCQRIEKIQWHDHSRKHDRPDVNGVPTRADTRPVRNGARGSLQQS